MTYAPFVAIAFRGVQQPGSHAPEWLGPEIPGLQRLWNMPLPIAAKGSLCVLKVSRHTKVKSEKPK
jgi:hypothetical protein